jgi:hypothetical protein
MFKSLLKSGLFALLSCLFVSTVTAQGVNNLVAITPACNVTPANNSFCTSTPAAYQVQIYEMGLCTAHPYGAAKTGQTFDTASCVVTYSDAAPTAVDIAANIGGKVGLSGTSSAPAAGVYAYPYIVMGTTFNVGGTYTSGGVVYYSTNSSSVSTSSSAYAMKTEVLNNFDGTQNVCVSGSVGTLAPGGIIDAFVTSTAFAREPGGSTSTCANAARVVGVMALTSPLTVTSKTYSVAFNFNMTNAGVQWFDSADGDIAPEYFGSGPFSGYFTVLSSD